MEEKVCITCGKKKALNEFSFRDKKIGQRSNKCKECQRIYLKHHYKKNKSIYREHRRKHQKKVRLENRKKLWKYLETHPCVDCGEDDPIVLEFDHKNSDDKAGNVADLMKQPCPWKRIRKEIKKCEVRCANCHRRKTAEKFGWYKNMGSNPTPATKYNAIYRV